MRGDCGRKDGGTAIRYEKDGAPLRVPTSNGGRHPGRTIRRADPPAWWIEL